MPLIHLLSFLLFTIILRPATGELEDGISYIVYAGKKDCFYKDIEHGFKMDFDMQVLAGGDLDITMVISSPSGKVLLHKDREPAVSEEITIEEKGTHEFCFDNTFSLFSDKTVFFDLGIDDYNENQDAIIKGYTLPKDDYEDVEKLWKTMSNLGAYFTQISDMQNLIRSKYKRHEFVQESNLRRVTWFSIGSSGLMILVGIMQVIMVRNLFK